jgi:hypothetical protein
MSRSQQFILAVFAVTALTGWVLFSSHSHAQGPGGGGGGQPGGGGGGTGGGGQGGGGQNNNNAGFNPAFGSRGPITTVVRSGFVPGMSGIQVNPGAGWLANRQEALILTSIQQQIIIQVSMGFPIMSQSSIGGFGGFGGFGGGQFGGGFGGGLGGGGIGGFGGGLGGGLGLGGGGVGGFGGALGGGGFGGKGFGFNGGHGL